MNAARLLKHYEQFADAPDAVAHLRRLIIDLAIRGKLLPQDPNNEPASELVKRIDKEKARLGIRSRSRGSLSLQPDTPNEIDLPAGWAIVTGAEIFPSRSGNSKLIKGTLHSEPADGRFPGYSAAGQDVWLDNWEYSGDAIILSAVGARCGKGFLATGKWNAVANTHIVWLLPNITVPAFAFLHLNNEAFWIRSGGAQPFLKVGNTLERPFFLPPLAEQHRIVAKVDELMEMCDRLAAARADREKVRDRLAVASLARLNATNPETCEIDARFVLDAMPALTARPDQIKALRHSILNLAVRGKLTRQDRKDEPASELLGRIAADKAKRAMSARDRRATQIKPLVGDNVPFSLPLNWVWVSFGDITISRDSDRVPVSREERERRAKVYDYYGASGVIDKIDGFLFDKPLLLIGEDGANLLNRSTPIAYIARGKYWVNNHAHVVDGISETFLKYIELFINATDLKPYITGTAQPKMNQAKMNGIAVALPPLAEQHRIVAKVDALMVLCDRLEASLTSAAGTRSRLLDALLAEALAPAVVREIEAAEMGA